MSRAEPLPVPLLCGFLGSGKTTLLNRLLRGEAGRGVAVIVNEIGDVALDARLIRRTQDDIVELKNGCVCCSVRGDLLDTVKALLRRRARRIHALPLTKLAIEGSGLAQPGPIVQTFKVEPELRAATRFLGVATVVALPEIAAQMAAYREAIEQIACADWIALNHSDRGDKDSRSAGESAVRAVNPTAALRRCVRAELESDELWELERITAFPLQPVAEEFVAATPLAATAQSVVLRSALPLDMHRLKIFLQWLSSHRDLQVLRVKGLLACRDHTSALMVQGTAAWLEFGPFDAPPPSESILVVIGQNLKPAELEQAFARLRTASLTTE